MSEAWINAIFEEFHGRFGNPFFAKFQSGSLDANGNDQGVENAKTVWAKRLAEFTPEEIARGVNTEYSYPPDLDAFRKACRPQLDYESAFHEAVSQMHLRDEGRDSWSNPAIYWAAVELGSDIMGANYHTVKARWKAALDKAIEGVRIGLNDTVIPQRPKLLSAPQRRDKEYSDVAKKELAKINVILNTEPAWRRKLREKGTSISVQKVKPAVEHLPEDKVGQELTI